MSRIRLNLRKGAPLKIFGLSLLMCAAPVAIVAATHTKAHAATEAAVAKPSVATGPKAVQIKGFAFTPKLLTVAVGTVVTWTNADDEAHAVTSTNKLFHSAALDTDDKYSFTFSKPGEYSYFCSLHPHMTGRIIVK